VTNTTLRDLITYSYGLRELETSNATEWVNADRFDIAAKAEGEPDRRTLTLMLRALLAERFKLQIHTETREDRPIFALVLARADGKLGPQMVAAEPGSDDPAQRQKRCEQEEKARGSFNSAGFCFPPLRVASLVSVLSYAAAVGRKVIDRTNLTGTYTFDLHYSADPNPDSGGTPLFTALQEQLGLRLESARGPVEVLVVDHAEHPTPD
jgi:uncharacterized protein (TIGR03435 family)